MSPRNENHRHSEENRHLSFPEPRGGTSNKERGAIRELKDARFGDRQTQQVLSMLSSLQSNFSSLLQVVSNRLSYDKEKEKAFDRLYQEYEELKKDQELNQLRPLYIDIILLIDRMNQIYKDKLDSGSASPELTTLLKTLCDELVEILYRRGVEPIYSTSHTFDPKIQQVVEVVPTTNPAEDNLVLDIVRHGFKYKEVVLRPEDVVIKKYQS